MPLCEYKCECGLLSERIVQRMDLAPEESECPRCSRMAKKRAFPSSVAFARSTMDNAPTDNFIGRDAELRWNAIHERKAEADKVRASTGQSGVSMTGRNSFAPVTETQKQLRTSLTEAVVASGGFKNAESVPGLK